MTLASDPHGANSVAVDATSVYWTSSGSAQGVVGPPGAVMKAPLAGGHAVTLASDQPYPTSLRVDGGYLYWVTFDRGTGSGSVVRESVCGGPAITLASQQPRLGSCVVSSDALYCTEGSSVVRIAPK